MQNSLSDPYYDRLHLFLRSSNGETERGRALVAASLIEEMLEEILKSFLADIKETKKLFDMPNAPLSTLSAKSLMCRSLQLISNAEFRDIDLVRKIRNEFAHNLRCSFSDEKIEAWSSKLSLGMAKLDGLAKSDKARVDGARSRFDMVTTSIIVSLYNRSKHVEKQRIQQRTFPD
ncbi:hypothetical protein AB1P65_07110 [Roseibium alexandrii]